MAGSSRTNRTAVPEGGALPTADGVGADAAAVPGAAIVQPLELGGAGCAHQEPIVAGFIAIDLWREAVPDATMLLQFAIRWRRRN